METCDVCAGVFPGPSLDGGSNTSHLYGLDYHQRTAHLLQKKEIPPRNRNRGRDVRIESHLHAIDKHASAEPHLPAKRISRPLPFPCGDSPDGNDNHPSVHRAPLSAGPAPPDAQACISIYGLTEHGISSNKLSLYSFKLQF